MAHHNALDALGLAYGDDSDDDDDDDDDNEEKSPSKSAVPIVPLAVSAPKKDVAAASSALPDAGNLLMSLPDEVDWTARPDAEDDEPQYDRKGTRYNSVALPASMRAESEQFNARTGQSTVTARQEGAAARKAVNAALASDSVAFGSVGGASSGAAASSSGTRNAPVAGTRKPAARGGLLLPPQLGRRSNVTTEDTASMRTAKRPKSNPGANE